LYNLMLYQNPHPSYLVIFSYLHVPAKRASHTTHAI
jgi:hypothetical protein